MLTWNDNLATGIEKIDNQHKEIFKRVNLLLTSMKDRNSKDEVLKLVDFLEEYVIEHFSDEEKYMLKYDYYNYNIQHSEHQNLKGQLDEFKIKFEKYGTTASAVIQIQQNIGKWCLNHISKLDKEFAEFLVNKVKINS